ncbi:Nn.00g108700.m01.CDS01 [Neocucurbitaria sp. VM-36]
MVSPKHYNALILGSGQGGTPLASHLTSLGQSVCLVERSHIGGCCVNEGCTPTKTLIASGRVAYLARRAADYGVGVGEEVKIDMQKIRQRKRDIVESFREGSEKRLKDAGVDVIMGSAKFVGPKEVQVDLIDSAETKNVTADKIFVNVGCRPFRPPYPGLDSVDQRRLLDSTSVQELEYVPQHLVVVGGGIIGLEYAQLLRRLGAKVTIVQRNPRLLSRREDPELAECMQDILLDDGINLLLNTTIDAVSKSTNTNLPISITTNNSKSSSKSEVQASHILFATGRVPNTDTLNLPAAGIATIPSGHIHVSPTLETSVGDIYAIGDVKGGPAFTHISYDDFRIIKANHLPPPPGEKETPSKLRTTDERTPVIPSVAYTDPQFASIGPPLPSLLSSNPSKTYITYSMPASWIARGLETDETRGMMKAVIDAETDRIVSFSAITVEAGDLMSVVQMAMLGGLTWMDLRDAMFAHPTWTEALNNLWSGERREGGGGGGGGGGGK